MTAALHRFGHEAMATRFELTLVHDDAATAAQAAQEVWADMDALEQQLSRFIPHSDISVLNGSPAGLVLTYGTAALLVCMGLAVVRLLPKKEASR